MLSCSKDSSDFSGEFGFDTGIPSVNERTKFYSVANDAKVQVTFDAETVESYRLIGYENRVLSEDDFDNDDKDAGEIGAGQTITALYELVPADRFEEKNVAAVFDFRYKESLGSESMLLSLDINAGNKSSAATELDFAAGVAAFGLVLRDSKYKGSATFEMARNLVESRLEFDPYGYRKQFYDLIGKAAATK